MSRAQGLPRTAADWAKRLSPPNFQKGGGFDGRQEGKALLPRLPSVGFPGNLTVSLVCWSHPGRKTGGQKPCCRGGNCSAPAHFSTGRAPDVLPLRPLIWCHLRLLGFCGSKRAWEGTSETMWWSEASLRCLGFKGGEGVWKGLGDGGAAVLVSETFRRRRNEKNETAEGGVDRARGTAARGEGLAAALFLRASP